MWQAVFYKTLRGNKPVEEFIEKLEEAAISKVFREIDMLKKVGPHLRMPFSKKITKNLFELRIRGTEEIRIFYCFIDRSIYLLHAFKKQSNKTPTKEIKTAQQIYRLLTNT